MMGAGGHKRRPWTAADDAQLAELIAEGWAQRRIGELVGRTEWSISARAAVIGARNPEASKRNSVVAQRAFWADDRASASTLRKIKQSWTPERRARQAEIARATTAAHPYRPPSPEGRRRMSEAVKAYHERQKAWIPIDLRATYTRLVRSMKAAAAREEVKRLVAERNAAMTPFERAMERVRQGAGIVQVRPLMRAEPSHSLTGCSMAMVAYG